MVTGSEGQEPAAGGGPEALVVACSDHRYRSAIEAFCRESLGISTWDALMVPGGIYMVSYPQSLPLNYRTGSRMLEFLLEQHHPGRVVLVAHEGCARYRAGLRLPPGRSIALQQQDDLKKVGLWLTERYPTVAVTGFYAANLTPEGATFTRVFPVADSTSRVEMPHGEAAVEEAPT